MKLITSAYKKMYEQDLISHIKSVQTTTDGDVEDILAGNTTKIATKKP